MDLRRIKNKDLSVRVFAICEYANIKTIGKAIEFATNYKGDKIGRFPFTPYIRKRFIEELKSI